MINSVTISLTWEEVMECITTIIAFIWAVIEYFKAKDNETEGTN